MQTTFQKSKQPSTGQPIAFDRQAIDRVLLQLIDLGLAAVIFIAPLFMGGRHPLGRLVFVCIVCVTALIWSVRQCVKVEARWRWSGAEFLLLAGLLLVFTQLVPLPPSLLQTVSPNISNLLPLWSSHGETTIQLGTWSTVSLAPAATRGGLIIFLAYALLFLVVVQRIESAEDVERLLRWIALSAVALATLGIAQYLFGNGKFF